MLVRRKVKAEEIKVKMMIKVFLKMKAIDLDENDNLQLASKTVKILYLIKVKNQFSQRRKL